MRAQRPDCRAHQGAAIVLDPGFRRGRLYSFQASGTADGNLSYDRVNSFRQGSGGGSYTVRAGDTLAGIAQAVWGDASLWYKLAEANGLNGDAMLTAGQSIALPAGVTRSHNNASTVKPYGTSEAVGAPTATLSAARSTGG